MWGKRQIATGTALLGALALVWVTASSLDSPTVNLPSDTSEAVTEDDPIGPAARSAAGGKADLPGVADTGVPANLDFSQPTDVARGYLAAAYTVRAADRGRTNRRALPYLHPENPDYPRGIVVLDAPGPAQTTRALVNRLDVVSKNEDGSAIAYRAQLTLSTTSNAASAEPAEDRTTFLVLRRQPDGRWLVVQDSPQLQPGD